VGLEAIPSGIELERHVGQPAGGDLDRLADFAGPLVPGVEQVPSGRTLGSTNDPSPPG
jgi:hypothetical protein